MKSVALHNLGCKVNAYEMEVMQQMLQENGYKVVPFDEIADIYIVNTCSVTNIADRKSRQMLHKAKSKNPESIVVAVGCYVQTGKEKILQDEGIDLAIGNNKKKDLLSILKAFCEEREREAEEMSDKTLNNTTIIDIDDVQEYEELQLEQTTGHTRAYIKIQDGCNQFCSYCIIPYARGRVRSRSEENIYREVKRLVSLGYQEIVLTGIHISSYGVDFTPEEGSLIHLIEAVHTIDGLERIRLGSLEPRIITEEFVERLRKLPKICPHFHLSLQSGCDKTLERMNRHYNTREYYDKTVLLRESYDAPAITTDIIVGFPEESEEDFAKTVQFLDKIHFYEMHIFKYSKRQGTKAAAMNNQIPEEIKTVRSNALFALEREQSDAYREEWIGKTAEMLIEESKEIDGITYQIGHTREYVKVALRSSEDLSGRIITGKITSFLQDDFMLFEVFIEF